MYLIALDDGHGMETAGKRTPPIPELGGRVIRENEFNRPLTDLLEKELKRCGFNTLQVAPETSDVSLYTRVNRANAAKAQLYISTHYNALDGRFDEPLKPDPDGYSVHVCPSRSPMSTKVATAIVEELNDGTMFNRGLKESDFYVVCHTNMPAVLVEHGFMDDKKDALKMIDPNFVKKRAQQLCKAICKAFGMRYVPEVIKPEGTYYRVVTGSFRTREEAEKRQAELKADGYESFISIVNL